MYQKVLEQFEEWLRDNLKFYKRGELCSLSESIHGEVIIMDCIAKLEEIKEKNNIISTKRSTTLPPPDPYLEN